MPSWPSSTRSRSPADRPDGGGEDAARRAASEAATPSSRRQAPVSWSTDVSSTRSGCRSRNRSSPSRPPATAPSAISAPVTVKRPAPCPAWMSRKARGASPRDASRASRPTPVRNRAVSGCVQPSRPEIRSATANISAGSLMSAQARSIVCPHRSSSSPDAVPNSCPLPSKWLQNDPKPMSAASVISWMLARSFTVNTASGTISRFGIAPDGTLTLLGSTPLRGTGGVGRSQSITPSSGRSSRRPARRGRRRASRRSQLESSRTSTEENAR